MTNLNKLKIKKKMKRKFIDNKAKRLFAIPTFKKAKYMVDHDVDALMNEEEYEAEDKLQNVLYWNVVEYLEDKGIYDKKKQGMLIRYLTFQRRLYASLTDMMCLEHCSHCPHLKVAFEKMQEKYNSILEELGILLPVSEESMKSVTKDKSHD